MSCAAPDFGKEILVLIISLYRRASVAENYDQPPYLGTILGATTEFAPIRARKFNRLRAEYNSPRRTWNLKGEMEAYHSCPDYLFMGPRVCLLLPPTSKTFGRGKLGFFSSTIIFVFAFIGVIGAKSVSQLLCVGGL